MSRKLVLALVLLLVGGVVGPLVVPPEHASTARMAIVALAAAAVVAMLKSFGAAAQKASEVAVPEGATVLRDGPANLKDGWVMIGGVLKLTPDQLVFSSHGFAQKASTRAWELKSFESIAPARAMGIVPNALLVRIGGTEIKLVVTEREGWMKAIQSAAVALRREAA